MGGGLYFFFGGGVPTSASCSSTRTGVQLRWGGNPNPLKPPPTPEPSNGIFGADLGVPERWVLGGGGGCTFLGECSPPRPPAAVPGLGSSSAAAGLCRRRSALSRRAGGTGRRRCPRAPASAPRSGRCLLGGRSGVGSAPHPPLPQGGDGGPSHVPPSPPLPPLAGVRVQVRMLPSESPVRTSPAASKMKHWMNLGFLYF